MDELNEIKSIAGIRLDHMGERVKRMEFAFDKLQAAILNRVGSYGNTLDSIKREMSMIENSMGKIAGNPIKKSVKKTSTKRTTKKKTTSRGKK
jgi:septation ring formation regulator EzrA